MNRTAAFAAIALGLTAPVFCVELRSVVVVGVGNDSAS